MFSVPACLGQHYHIYISKYLAAVRDGLGAETTFLLYEMFTFGFHLWLKHVQRCSL